VIPLLRSGDVLAHPFTRHPGGFVNREGECIPSSRRPSIADAGRCRPRQPLLLPPCPQGDCRWYHSDHAGADIHGYNTHVPAPAGTPDEHVDDENHPFAGQAKIQPGAGDEFDDGARLKLEQVVPMVTSHPPNCWGVQILLAALRPGMDADVTVLTEKPGRLILRDNEKTEVVADSLLQPAFCLRAGVRHDRCPLRSCRVR